MDFSKLFIGISESPELALTAFVIGMMFLGIHKLVKSLFKFFGGHLESIDNNFKAVSADLTGLRIEITKIGEKLEAQSELIDHKIDNLDRRVEKLERKDS